MTAAVEPPKILAALLARILPRDWREAGTGDFEEHYADIFARRGRKPAVAWYALQILRTLFPFILDIIRWRFIMLKNHFLITFRDIRKNKVSSLINIFGLAVGIACCFLFMLLVRYETSFDRFHKDADRIFRVAGTTKAVGSSLSSSISNDALGPQMAAEIPEVVDYFRIHAWTGFVVEASGKRLMTDPCFADENLFRFFSFPLIQGNPASVLVARDSAVISQSLSTRMFGRENPIGKIVTLYAENARNNFTVTGVMRNMPPNSHLQFDFVAPLAFLKSSPSGSFLLVSTYVRLHNTNDGSRAESKFPSVVKHAYGDARAQRFSFRLQKLADLHMHSDLDFEFSGNANKVDPKIFKTLALIALLVLLIAAINSINLATARASRRALEVGLRKVIGAGRGQLVRQFLAEAVILAFMALAIGLLLAALLLPGFNALMDKKMTLDFAVHLPLLGGLLALTLAVSVLSGLYPAAFLASYKPAESLGGQRVRSGGCTGGKLRKGLAVVQFSLSVVFIIMTLTVWRQLAYVRAKDLGVDLKNVVAFLIGKDETLSSRFDVLQKEFMKIPSVIGTSFTSNFPGKKDGFPFLVSLEDMDKKTELFSSKTGPDTFDFFGVKMIQGTGYAGLTVEGMKRKVFLNESGARTLGLAEAVGRRVRCEPIQLQLDIKEPLEIAGIVRDFHIGSLHEKIPPTIFYFQKEPYYALVRFRAGKAEETLAGLKEAWSRLQTPLPFDPIWVEELVSTHGYGEDRKAGKTFFLASMVSIGLACMGIYGTVAFAVGRRRREIGIRKVLGATERGVLWMLIKEFSRPVLAAIAVAWPLGIYISRNWLNGFAYRTGISWWAIPLSAGIALTVALLSIITQALPASRENPADTIRYE